MSRLLGFCGSMAVEDIKEMKYGIGMQRVVSEDDDRELRVVELCVVEGKL